MDLHTAVKPETEIDDKELELRVEDPTALQEAPLIVEQATQQHYPMRNSRRPPAYLKDYVGH